LNCCLVLVIASSLIIPGGKNINKSSTIEKTLERPIEIKRIVAGKQKEAIMGVRLVNRRTWDNDI
jgi:hypothetical protein